MAEHADGSLPWGRFESRLDGKVVAADPDTAAAREAERVREQLARRTRSSEQGTAGFYVRSTAGVIARIDATVAYFAEALAAFGDRDDLDQRRVKAMVLLCNPTRAVELLASYAWLRSAAGPALLSGEPDPELAFDDDAAPGEDEPVPPPDALSRMDAFARRVGFGPTRLPDWLVPRFGPPDAPPDGSRFRFDWSSLLPQLTLNLHLSAADLAAGGGGVARWEGVGPVTHQFVHEHLRPLHRYRIQPVIDLAGMAPVDAYEIPDRLRAAVRLRTPADAFPFSSAVTGPGVAMDEDHTEPFVPATGSRGEKDWATRLGNLAPLGRFHHRIKTHGRWTVRQPFDGIVLWRDPQGQVYLVDHTGTHKVTGPGVAAGGAPPYDPDLDLCPAGDLLVEYLPV
jgi:hypothetical protein